MTTTKSTATKQARRLKVGDVVRFEDGSQNVVANRLPIRSGGWAGSVKITFAERGAYAYYPANEPVTVVKGGKT